jgi:hypothetical protein
VATSSDSICTACGLCCSGAIYDKVPVWPVEADKLRLLGVAVEKTETGTQFPQPCSMLTGARCSIYADRPTNCRAYRCELLKRFDDGGIARAEALAIIGKAVELFSAVQSELDPGQSVPEARKAWRVSLAARSPGDPAKQGFMLKQTLLNFFLDKYFRNPVEHQMTRPD